MTTWSERADEAIAHNLADVLAGGPRLAWGRKTAEVAIDRRRGYVQTTGLGAMGVGTMWRRYSNEDPEWADLPEEDSTGQFGAETPEELDERYRAILDGGDRAW